MSETLARPQISFTHINKCAGTTILKWLKSNTLVATEGYKHYIPNYDYVIRQLKDLGDQILYNSRLNKLENSSMTTLIKFEDDVLYLTVVRNPYDRMASHFFQWKRNRFFNGNCSDINSFIFTLAKFYEKGPSYSNMDMLVKTSTMKYFRYDHGSTISIKYRPAIDKRFVMPCTFWVRDIDRFNVFKLEDAGLNNFQRFISNLLHTSYLPLSRILPIRENTNPDFTNQFADNTTNTYKHLYNKKSIDIINNLFHDDFETFGYGKI